MLPESDKPSPENSNGQEGARDDGVIDPVWIVYFDGRPLEINRAFGGYTLEEWRYGGKAFYQQAYTPESYQRLRELTRQMRTTRRPQHNVEVALRSKDGSRLYYFLVNYRPLLGNNGDLIGMRGDARNITDLREAQEALRQNELKFRDVINVSPVPYALNDDHQRVTFLNPEFVKTFGYTIEDIPTLADWWPKAYPDPEYRHWVMMTWAKHLEKAKREGSAFEPLELNIQCRDGTYRTVLVGAAALGESWTGTHLVILYDITDRKRTEMEREQLLEELTRRNVEMENFTYTISHDLKAPLITISGFTQLLIKDFERNDKKRGRESIEEIRKATDGMQQLIEDLLLFSRIGCIQNEPEDVDIHALLSEVQARCTSHIERERATIRVVSPLPRLHVDRLRFSQVLQNLLDNGVKFHREGLDPVLEIGAVRNQGETRLYVRDNGIGIKKRYQEKIFGLFQRLDTQREGTGVGLTIARRIVEQHGGKLWVESEPGRGSTFWISLPDSVIVDGGAGEPARDIRTLR